MISWSRRWQLKMLSLQSCTPNASQVKLLLSRRTMMLETPWLLSRQRIPTSSNKEWVTGRGTERLVTHPCLLRGTRPVLFDQASNKRKNAEDCNPGKRPHPPGYHIKKPLILIRVGLKVTTQPACKKCKLNAAIADPASQPSPPIGRYGFDLVKQLHWASPQGS